MSLADQKISECNLEEMKKLLLNRFNNWWFDAIEELLPDDNHTPFNFPIASLLDSVNDMCITLFNKDFGIPKIYPIIFSQPYLENFDGEQMFDYDDGELCYDPVAAYKKVKPVIIEYIKSLTLEDKKSILNSLGIVE